MEKIRTISVGIVLLLTGAVTLGYYQMRERKFIAPDTGGFVSAAEACRSAGKNITVHSFRPGQEAELQDVLNSPEDCVEVRLSAGKFRLDNSLTLARVRGVILRGAGINATTVEFSRNGNTNGIDGENLDSVEFREFSVMDAPKNDIEVRQSRNILFHKVRTTWSATSGPERTRNGAYGIYPVNVRNVILEYSEAYHASDAGLYVGQCTGAIVRHNRAEFNVMGLEIENTQNADVYGNVTQNNTGGLLVYDLHTNPMPGRNIRFFDNVSVNNNGENFASGGIVRTVPSGVGFIITAARETEIRNNTFGGNHTADIAIIHGLVSETPDTGQWPLKNFRVRDISIHHNRFTGGSGTAPDNGRTDAKARPMGALLEEVLRHMKEAGRLPGNPNIIYDGVDAGRTILVMTTYFGNRRGNHNHICLAENEGPVILADLNLPALLANQEEPTDASIRAAIDRGDTLAIPLQAGGDFTCSGYQVLTNAWPFNAKP